MTFFRLLHLQRSTYIIVFNFLIHCIIDRISKNLIGNLLRHFYTSALNTIQFCDKIIFIDSTNMNDLKIGCDVIHRPKGVAQDVQINNLPNECTSLILCLGDFDSKSFLFQYYVKYFYLFNLN